jgi:glycosyltransferase involved in cell wall biosynthesis
MKVLLLTQVLPFPPDSGPKIKTWNTLKYLAARHEVTLVSFVRGDQSEDIKVLRRVCAAVHSVPISRTPLLDGMALIRSLTTGLPWVITRDDRAAMHHLLDQVARQVMYDVVHADQLNMAQYALPLPAGQRVLDNHNALWLLYKRLWQTLPAGPKKALFGRDWQLMKDYEGEMCRRFDGVIAVSENDRSALREAAGNDLDIAVIPIAVDTHEVTPIQRNPGSDHILHIGTMFWPPNVDGVLWFLREIFPLVRSKLPDTRFDVVGARPPHEVVAAGQADGVNVTGYVADPGPYLRDAGAVVVPLRAGGGMRVKILEALAQGLPVVTTTLGCEGIAVEHSRHLLIADTPEAFAQAVVRLLQDRPLAEELGRNGRRLIEERYDYRVAYRPLDDLYSSITDTRETHDEILLAQS